MVSLIIGIIWFIGSIILLGFLLENDSGYAIGILLVIATALAWIIPFFSGFHIKNNEGQYKGFVVAVEQNGAFFKGWNVFLKTELESSDSDKACINRKDTDLIESLKNAQKNKENITVEYEGMLQYKVGECPGSSWMVTKIIE